MYAFEEFSRLNAREKAAVAKEIEKKMRKIRQESAKEHGSVVKEALAEYGRELAVKRAFLGKMKTKGAMP